MDTRNKELLGYLKRDFAGEYRLQEPLSLHTWYRIGGPADFFLFPRSTSDLVSLLSQCRRLGIDICLIGEGANMLASDSGYRGAMINMTRYFKRIGSDQEVVMVEAGLLLKDLVLFCERNCLGGMQYLSGIPGSVGGALRMNAGTHDGEIGDHVSEVCLLNTCLEIETVASDQIDFGYRVVPQLEGAVVLGCKFELQYEKESILREIRINQVEKRSAKQPLEYPNCGSVFKRPKKHYVGKLVEESGLKGLRCGDAMISAKHAGFIVNLGNAKASQIMHLIKKVQDEIYERFGIELEPEVKFVGFQ